MLSIFFEDKVINFTACKLQAGYEELAPCDLTIAKVLQKLENSKPLAVISPDYVALFEKFCAQFALSEAAGGVVENPRGDVLMIHKGRWDLPKGHREQGETWAGCAVREVGEECGIEGVQCGGFVARTWHTYIFEGVWTLKKCQWYAMRYDGPMALEPQLDEQIDDARWVPREELPAVAEVSYRTIRNVLGNYNSLRRAQDTVNAHPRVECKTTKNN